MPMAQWSKHVSRLCIPTITCLIFSCMAAAEIPTRVTVSAGAADRTDSIACFAYPTKGPLQLRDADGNVTYAWSDGSQARFVVDALKANTTRTYQLNLVGDADKRPPDVRIRK